MPTASCRYSICQKARLQCIIWARWIKSTELKCTNDLIIIKILQYTAGWFPSVGHRYLCTMADRGSACSPLILMSSRTRLFTR